MQRDKDGEEIIDTLILDNRKKLNQIIGAQDLCF